MIKELLELARTIRDEKKYRAQLLRNNLTVDAFEFFLKKSQQQGVKITMDFSNGQKVSIEPSNPTLPVKSFRDKYNEAHSKVVER